MTDEETIQVILNSYATIAVYGMSTDPSKPSHSVPLFLQSKGYIIIPINPGADMIAGCRCFSKLNDVTEKIDILDVFRPSEQAPDIVKEARARKQERGDIEVIWLQLGIHNEVARKEAEEAGFLFIQDRCMKREYQRINPT